MSTTTEKNFHGLRLIASCGAGAYGEVWYCEDLSGQRMALKIIPKTRLGGAWERELQGVRNYRRITQNSPALLKIFHVAEDEDSFYYTMEAADNAGSDGEYLPDTLARRLQSGALPPEQLFPTLRGIFDGIRAIHDAGFAHRDIKPDNIIFVGGVPKIGDIGLLSSLSNSMTKLAGTLEFLPPEVRSSPASADRASRQRGDLYAFGKVVYCAATGMDAASYPSLPTDAELSPEFKFFTHLSFRLCAGRQGLRIASVDELDKVMKQIERELERGGKHLPPGWRARHWADRFLEWTRRHVLALLLVAVFAAAGAALPYLIRKKTDAPKPPTEPTAAKTRTLVDPQRRFTIDIPFNWEVMSEYFVKQRLKPLTEKAAKGRLSPYERYRLDYLKRMDEKRGTLIRCSFDDNDFFDTVEIFPDSGMVKDDTWHLSDRDLLLAMQHEAAAQKFPDFAIYGVRHTKVGGFDALLLELSNNPARHHQLVCVIYADDGTSTTIALTARNNTFHALREPFEAALRTLKFTK